MSAIVSGPISIQMNDVTNTVNDLIHSYEQLVHTLPNLTNKVQTIHNETEELAIDLEKRTKGLIDGYDYLEGLSSQIPQMLIETAAVHRKTLQDSILLLNLNDKEQLIKQEQQLQRVKGELRSISHERVIMDVLTRNVITETKRIHNKAEVEALGIQQRKYTKTNSASSSTSIKTINKSTTGTTTNIDKVNNNKSLVNINKDPIHLLQSSIYIPDYKPGHYINKQQQQQQNSSNQFINNNKNNNNNNNNNVLLTDQQNSVYAKAVGNGLMVPAMRHGTLPSEVQNLHTVPTSAVTAQIYMEQEMLNRQKLKKKLRRPSVNLAPFAKSIKTKFDHTEEEVHQLREKMTQATTLFQKQQLNAKKKLALIAQTLENKQYAHDTALLSAVEKLMKEAIDPLKATKHNDADVLKALHFLLLPQPNPHPPHLPRQNAVDNAVEYKVMTPRKPVHANGAHEYEQSRGYDKTTRISSNNIPQEHNNQMKMKKDLEVRNDPTSIDHDIAHKLTNTSSSSNTSKSDHRNSHSEGVPSPPILGPHLYCLEGNQKDGVHWVPAPVVPSSLPSTLPHHYPIIHSSYSNNTTTNANISNNNGGSIVNRYDPNQEIYRGIDSELQPSEQEQLQYLESTLTYKPSSFNSNKPWSSSQINNKNSNTTRNQEIHTQNITNLSHIPAINPINYNNMDMPISNHNQSASKNVPEASTLYPYPPSSALDYFPGDNAYYLQNDVLFDKLRRDGPYWLSKVGVVTTNSDKHDSNKNNDIQSEIKTKSIPDHRHEGVEKELVHLMHSVVQTHQQTMQGNQALLLTLIHDRFPSNDEKYDPTTPPATTTSPPNIIPEQILNSPSDYPTIGIKDNESEDKYPSSVPIDSNNKYQYYTSLGEVLLGGDIMTGPYTTKPTILSKEDIFVKQQSIAMKKAQKDKQKFDIHIKSISNPDISIEDNIQGVKEVVVANIEDNPDIIPSRPKGQLENEDEYSEEFEEDVVDNTLNSKDNNHVLKNMGTLSDTSTTGINPSSVAAIKHALSESIQQNNDETDKFAPPQLRRVASAAIMRMLYPNEVQEQTRIPHSSNTSQQQEQVDNVVDDITTNNSNNMKGGNNYNMRANNVFTPELLSQKVSEGIQLGIKEVLGLLDVQPQLINNTRTNATTNNSNNASHRGREGIYPLYPINYPDPDPKEFITSKNMDKQTTREQLEHAHSSGDMSSINSSVDCRTNSWKNRNLKNRRRTNHDRVEALRTSNQRYKYMHKNPSSTVTGYSLLNTNYKANHTNIHSNDALPNEQILKDIEHSKLQKTKLMHQQIGDSYDDSISIDEETYAFIGDNYLFNNKIIHSYDHEINDNYNINNMKYNHHNKAFVTNSISSNESEDHIPLSLLHRNEHVKLQHQLFSDTNHIDNNIYMCHNSNIATQKTSEKHISNTSNDGVLNDIADITNNHSMISNINNTSTLVPLVSKVLQQSATEEILSNKLHIGIFSNNTNNSTNTNTTNNTNTNNEDVINTNESLPDNDNKNNTRKIFNTTTNNSQQNTQLWDEIDRDVPVFPTQSTKKLANHIKTKDDFGYRTIDRMGILRINQVKQVVDPNNTSSEYSSLHSSVNNSIDDDNYNTVAAGDYDGHIAILPNKNNKLPAKDVNMLLKDSNKPYSKVVTKINKDIVTNNTSMSSNDSDSNESIERKTFNQNKSTKIQYRNNTDILAAHYMLNALTTVHPSTIYSTSENDKHSYLLPATTTTTTNLSSKANQMISTNSNNNNCCSSSSSSSSSSIDQRMNNKSIDKVHNSDDDNDSSINNIRDSGSTSDGSLMRGISYNQNKLIKINNHLKLGI